MVEHVIRPNRHSHPSKHGSKRWPKKTAAVKIWPRPKREPEFTAVIMDPVEAGINPDEENVNDERQNENLPKV
jgi:hypothetical protein